jgi:hypothetical protein
MRNEIKKILIDYGVEGEQYSDLEEYLSKLLEAFYTHEGLTAWLDENHPEVYDEWMSDER